MRIATLRLRLLHFSTVSLIVLTVAINAGECFGDKEDAVYQYVIYQSLTQAMSKLNLDKYAANKVSYEVKIKTNTLAADLIDEIIAKALHHNSLKAEQKAEGDYNLKFIVSICGLHSYDGIIRRKIEGMAMINLIEESREGAINEFSSGLERYAYKGILLTPCFIRAVFGIVVITLAGLFAVFICRRNRREPEATGHILEK